MSGHDTQEHATLSCCCNTGRQCRARIRTSAIHAKASAQSTDSDKQASSCPNPSSAHSAGDPFSELEGCSLPPKGLIPVAWGQVQRWAGSWGGVGALSPEPRRPAHLFISEAALDWISR